MVSSNSKAVMVVGVVGVLAIGAYMTLIACPTQPPHGAPTFNAHQLDTRFTHVEKDPVDLGYSSGRDNQGNCKPAECPPQRSCPACQECGDNTQQQQPSQPQTQVLTPPEPPAEIKMVAPPKGKNPGKQFRGVEDFVMPAVQRLSNPKYLGIYDDLKAFSGLTDGELQKRLKREGIHHFKKEYDMFNPRTPAEQLLFYRFGIGYLWGNVIHHPWIGVTNALKGPEYGRVLDYAGGVGHNTIDLAKKGFKVDYFEVSLVQMDFTRFRATKHNLHNKVDFLSAYPLGTYDPKAAIPNRQYQGIILQDVLEHVPDYHVLLRHLISCLRPGGFILEQSPFDGGDLEMGVHLKPSMSMQQAMGPTMRRLRDHVWQKTGDLSAE